MAGLRPIVLVMCLMVPGLAAADQADERLDPLFDQLKTASEAEEARFIERLIWRIWLDSGRQDVNQLMARGIQAMARRRMASARLLFDQVVEMAPGYAEGWNKRATVYYLEDNLPASMLDIERTLTLEPRHFGALSGMGLIFSEVEDVEGALEAFEAVLEIHPHSPTARASAEELRRKIRDEAL